MSDLKPADIQELMRYIRKKTKKGPGYVGDLKGETLDALSGELNNILRVNNVFKESTTFSILSATKKIMKDFDDARNNKTYIM